MNVNRMDTTYYNECISITSLAKSIQMQTILTQTYLLKRAIARIPNRGLVTMLFFIIKRGFKILKGELSLTPGK